MIRSVAQKLIRDYSLNNSFYVYDLPMLRQRIAQWNAKLPYVQPFYAMKCNPDRNIMSTLSSHRVGFDCASQREIEIALNSTQSNMIIFANPCKHPTDISFADYKGVPLTTFDSKSEIDKLKNSNMSGLIRIKINNPDARVQLGTKYGVELHTDECRQVLEYAKQQKLNVSGVSFHVGSVSNNPMIYEQAVLDSCRVFKMMRDIGFMPNVLDIGGGFTSSNFDVVSSALMCCLRKHLHAFEGVRVIAEPGRYFAEDVATFFTPVIGKRERLDVKEYWITDGLYGSFNCMLYDKQLPEIDLLYENQPESSKLYESKLFGQTCDSFDELKYKKLLLPDLKVGDWLMFPKFGAYTIAGATDFNGINMTRPDIFYM